jgi:hypothetical protein
MKTLLALTAALALTTSAAQAQTYYSRPINPGHPELGYNTDGPGGSWSTRPINPSHPELGFTTTGPGYGYNPNLGPNLGITNPFGR